MSAIEKLTEEYNAKIKEIQDNCPHIESFWIPLFWLPMRFCPRCGNFILGGWVPKPILEENKKEQKPKEDAQP